MATSLLSEKGIHILTSQDIPTSENKYEILGDDMQVLNMRMASGEIVECNPGSMSYMSPNMTAGVNCDNCCGRCMGGNSCLMTRYTNKGNEDSYIALTPSLPAKVIPFDLGSLKGTKMRCKSGTYLAHIDDVQLEYDFDCNPLTCCCGGQGCVRQVMGGTGTSFLYVMGTIVKKTLADGEVLTVDTSSLVAWEETVALGVRAAGGCCVCCCGGEGLFNTTLTGPGTVYIQSYSREKFRAAIMAMAPKKNTGGAGGGAPSAEAIER